VSAARYPYANQLFLEGDIDWRNDPIVVLLVGTQSFSYDPIHRHLSDIPVAMRVAQSGTLEGRTTTLGVADAADIDIRGVTGPEVGALVLMRTTDEVLISFQNDAVGLPFFPDGSTVRVHWDNTEFKVFKL
jgi:hypothetical protein